jgi:hypothetical protein
MSTRTIEQLERELRDDERMPPARPDLAAIREAGLRRRRLAALGTATGVLVSVVVLGLVVSALTGAGGDRAREPEPAAHPHQLSELAQRALAEVPGATQVSDWQVVVPRPTGGRRQWESVGDPVEVAGTPVDTGAHRYTGVTDYRRSDFPRWLYDGVQHIEQTELADADGSYPVGSTAMGILVDGGPAYLGCVGTAARCSPALLTRSGDQWVYEWGMGTDGFLEPGSKMEVFLSDDYATGAPGQLVLAGLDGTDVSRVELVTTDGTRTEGHVESGTVVPGDTMLWGTVSGDLAAVIAYDANGDVIEDHELKPCSDPVDCEVR